jgi:hypothetical protein
MGRLPRGMSELIYFACSPGAGGRIDVADRSSFCERVVR